MPEPTNHQDVTSSSSSVPTTNSRWLKVRKWLISAVIIAAVSLVFKIFEPDSIAPIKKANESFVKGVKAVDPFRLATTFYDYLASGERPAPRPPRALNDFRIPVPEPTPNVTIPLMLWRIIPGAWHTAGTIISAGWVSTITSAIALFLGFMFVRSGMKGEEPSLYMTLLILLAVPLIGSVLVWLLLQLMWLASLVFGGLLAGAEMVAAFSVVPPVAWALVKKGEHDLTGKIIKGLTERH